MNPLKPEWLQAVAKWLPHDLRCTIDSTDGTPMPTWAYLVWIETCVEVLPTEMEHVMWLMEEKIPRGQQVIYWNALCLIVLKENKCREASYESSFALIHATPAQRLAAFYEAVGKNLK